MGQVDSSLPKQKIFGVGLNKTGTSSLKAALQHFGYRVCGPRRHLLHEIARGNISGIDPIVSSYDAFEDLPWPLVFEHLFATYGETSKFVLTTRSTPEKWLKSVLAHARTNGLFSDSWSSAYGFYRPFGREKEFIDFYLRHNDRVRNFFAWQGASDKLLEVCFDTDDGWETLCGFIGLPVPDVPFPHVNRTNPDRKRLNQTLNKIVEPAYRVFAALTPTDTIKRMT